MDRARAGGARAAQGEVAAAEGLAGVDVGEQGGHAGDGGEPQRAAGVGTGPTAATRRAATVSASAIAAVDEDDEVAVLAAGQPVLAAQRAGEPGGERAQDGGPRCRAAGRRRPGR